MENDISLISAALENRGFTLWEVGGAVRDSLLGLKPKDRDFATDASPEIAMEIYNGIPGARVIPTGLQHGTVSVQVSQGGEFYEITTLRIDVETDGRHAEVAFTDSIIEDLRRRDLTINAMARTMDGTLIDPFGGEADLRNGVVRFVGNAGERMAEDYLRIMRFFRFAGRFANLENIEIPPEMYTAIRGLEMISGERIWMEFSKIISGRNNIQIVGLMERVGVMREIGFTKLMSENLVGMEAIQSPASRLGLVTDETTEIAIRWKLSLVERKRAAFMNSVRNGVTMAQLKFMRYVDEVPLDWIFDAATFMRFDREIVATWGEIPRMPVNGIDVMTKFEARGQRIGEILKQMQTRWVESDYTMTHDDLINGNIS